MRAQDKTSFFIEIVKIILLCIFLYGLSLLAFSLKVYLVTLII